MRGAICASQQVAHEQLALPSFRLHVEGVPGSTKPRERHACPAAALRQVKQALKALMGSVHVSVTAACAEYHERFRRSVYVTPKSYMSFLEGYRWGVCRPDLAVTTSC